MAGQLIQRGDQTWLVRVFMGRDPDTGKRKYHNKTIRGTKKDAQRYLNKVQREQDLGTFTEPSRQTVATYLRQWLQSAAKGKLRPQTYQSYESLIRRHVLPRIGDRRLSQLGPVEVQALYTEMQEQGLSARTVRYVHAILRSALTQAVKWRLITHNPLVSVELPRQMRREMHALAPQDASRLLDAAQSDRWHALWVLLVTTGLRPSEALALRWTDLDGERIRVQRTLVRHPGLAWSLQEPKTSRSRRTVALPKSAVRALQQHKAKQNEEKLRAGSDYEDHGLIFASRHGTPLDGRLLVRRCFKPLLQAAELPDIRLYDLRHTCATLLLAAGDNPKIVSERLGHSTITLTMDTYSHVLPDMQQASAEKLEGMLFGANS